MPVAPWVTILQGPMDIVLLRFSFVTCAAVEGEDHEEHQEGKEIKDETQKAGIRWGPLSR